MLVAGIEAAGYTPGRTSSSRSTRPRARSSPSGSYDLAHEGRTLSAAELAAYWAEAVDNYPIISIEDGMDEEDWDGWQRADRRDRRSLPARRRRPLRHQPRAPAPRDRGRRRQLDPRQGEPDRHADGDVRGRSDGPRGGLHGGHVPPLRRDRGHDHRRPGGRHRLWPDQDRARRRAPIGWRSTTSCSGSRRSWATRRPSPGSGRSPDAAADPLAGLAGPAPNLAGRWPRRPAPARNTA